VEFDLSLDPDLHGPFTQDERDDQLGESLYMHTINTPCVMIDVVDGKLSAWRPSYQLRKDSLAKFVNADLPSELRDDNATRMWSNDNPPAELRAIRSLSEDRAFREGRDEN
jgi:hypothetical protein